ncbi:MAG: zf-HC2 domain-containing protein [Vicinamibacteraceae bacterium]
MEALRTMLTCKDVTERLTAYLEHDLSWWERMQFLFHLAMCRFCGRYVSQMRTTLAVLRRLAEPSTGARSIDPSLRETFRASHQNSNRAPS